LWWQSDQDRSGTLSQQEFLSLCGRPEVSFRIQQAEANLGGGGMPGGMGGGMPGGGMGGFPPMGRNVIWGVNGQQEIYMRIIGQGWKKVDGALKGVSVSHDGLNVWGVNAQNQIFVRTGVTPADPDGASWQLVDGSLDQVAAGINHAVGSNAQDEIYSRGGIQQPHSPAGGQWAKIDGGLKQIALGPNGELAGCNAQDQIYWRNGAAHHHPRGDSWQQMDGQLVCIAVGQHIWGVNRAQQVYHRAGLQAPWQADPSGPAAYIATTANGFTVKLAPDNNIWTRNGPYDGQWQPIDGQLVQCAVGCI